MPAPGGKRRTILFILPCLMEQGNLRSKAIVLNIRNVDKAPWTCPVLVGLLFAAPWAGSLERRVHGNPIGCSQDAYPAVSGPGGNAAKGNF